MKSKINLIIDFDSTLVKVETLDVLAEISFGKDSEKINEIKRITNAGMEGKVVFEESLKKRFQLLNLDREKIKVAKKIIFESITKSALKNKEFFKKYQNIYIISGGFKEFIVPVANRLNIPEKNIFANEFIYAKDKIYFDENNLLARNMGKVNKVRNLNLRGKTIVVGDGITDLEIKNNFLADYFISFTENVERDSLDLKADLIAKSFDDVFEFISKVEIEKPKALLLENVNKAAKDLLTVNGFNVESIESSLLEDELIENIRNVNVLGIRSKTRITKKVLDSANNLSMIAAFCVGTDQIDLDYCAMKNIKVINAPYSNTRSVAELALGEIILLMRNIFNLNNDLHSGVWNKKSGGSFEIRNKKLGIVGYGNVGSQLGILAESLGMQVYFYDIVDKLSFGNSVKLESLEELLSISDVVSVHIDGRAENKNFISEKEFIQMKDGVIFLNLSRGVVVDESALVKNLKTGKIRGAGIDVYREEPEKNGGDFKTKLMNFPNVILTPHIGGSTEEAQIAIGEYVSKEIINNFL